MSLIHLTEEALAGATPIVDLSRLQRTDAQVMAAMQARLDAAQAGFDIYDLTDVEQEVVKEVYQPKEGLMLFPVKPDLELHMKKTRYYVRKTAGEAKIVTGVNTAKDIPMISTAVEPVEDKVHRAMIGFPVTDEEMAANAALGRDELMEGMELCKEYLDDKMDRVIFEGEATHGVRSAFEELKVKEKEVTAITEASSADDDIATLNEMMNSVVEGSKNSMEVRPNRLALPLTTYNIIATKPRANTDKSVLMWFVENSPYLARVEDVRACSALETASSTGGKLGFSYRFDPKVVQVRIMTPRLYKIVEMVTGIVIVWHCKFSPVQWKQPLGAQRRRFASS